MQLSWTGKFLLARAALKALVASRQAQSQKAAVSTASQEVEVSARECSVVKIAMILSGAQKLGNSQRYGGRQDTR